MSPEPSNAPPVAPEPGHRHLTIQHLTIQMEIADIPTVVDSGGGMGHISPQEPPSQPNTPTLRAPFTGLNEKLVKVQRCPATVGPGCTRSRGESGLRLAGMFRPSRKGAGIAGTIAMRSAPYGAGLFCCARPGAFGKGIKRCDLELTLNATQDMAAQPGKPDIAVVLVGRGSSYSRQPAEDLSSLACRLRSACPEWLVEVAILEQGGPSLPQALDACQQASAGTIVVLPVFLPLENATRNWLRFLARRWLERLPAPARVLLAGPFDNPGNLANAVMESVDLALQSGAAVATANDQAGAPDPDWSVIPPHSYHVLFCQGPRCTAAGAAEVGAWLRMRLKDAGLDRGPGYVLAARTGCLYPCNLGPVMVVYPDGTWYCGLDEDAVSRIVDRHFVNGEPLSANAFRPSPHQQSLRNSQTPHPESLGDE